MPSACGIEPKCIFRPLEIYGTRPTSCDDLKDEEEALDQEFLDKVANEDTDSFCDDLICFFSSQRHACDFAPHNLVAWRSAAAPADTNLPGYAHAHAQPQLK